MTFSKGRPVVSTDYLTCPACKAERELASYSQTRFPVEGSVCDFCLDEGVPPPPAPEPELKPSKVRTKPKIEVVPTPPLPKRRGPKPKEPLQVVDPTLAAPTTPPKVDNIPQEVLEEPYTPPSFDQKAAEADPTRELALRTLARRRLLPFIQRFRPKYMPGWVHKDICRRLERFVEAVEQGKEPRLLLMMPPRAGKSEVGSRHFPPWVLGKHPDWEIIAASHTGSLSLSFSRYIRDLLRDPAYHAVFPDAVLDPSSQSVENWNLTGGGGYLAAGVGTGITGRGAHILLLDDLVKDQEAADSPTIRENTWEWYISTAHSRLAPGGGVLGITCLTGDTMVMMADGSHRRLDTLRKSDDVATYANGSLKATKVKAFKSNGRDSVFKIKTISGKIVRANQRHPFLTVDPKGELVWTRTRALTTAHKIVTAKGNGVSGRASLAPLMAVTSLRSAGECADLIIQKSGGLTAEGQSPTTTRLVETPASSIAMESRQSNTTRCSSGKVAAAQFAKNPQVPGAPQITGKTSSRSTTVTRQGLCEGSCAMAAMQESDTLGLSRWHWPRPNISDFTLEEVVSVEADGSEEVFDVQIEHTENFIANGFVSHNTWWNEDDWAGRIQEAMKGEGEKFEIVRYPALNEEGDEYILLNDTIVEIAPGHPVPDGAVMTRPHNTALHPERYTTAALLRKKMNYIAAGMRRMWNALYQQNPTPDSGIFFTKNLFRRYVHPPHRKGRRIYQAWDFAITENAQSDYTVCATILQDEFDNLYVIDIFRFKSDDGNAIVEHMIDQYVAWDVDHLGVEDGQIWKTLRAQFEKRCTERRVYPTVEVLVPLTDKLVRANPLKGRMQLGKVYFPEDNARPWVEACVRELIVFPNGKHDDQVDAIAWAVRLTLNHAAPKDPAPKQSPLKSWKDKLKGMLHGQGGGHMAAFTMLKRALITTLAGVLIMAPAEAGKTPRSSSARTAFVHLKACPSTGANKLPCPGYVIDHIIPLACAGADRPENMQWQTKAEAKEKDRWERRQCGY
jgi:predicted phage terminase large subunit-like protein